MFDFAFSEQEIEELLKITEDVNNVEDFLDRCFDGLLQRTSRSLSRVRDRISSELMRRVAAAIDEASNDLAHLRDEEFFLPLRNDLAASRQDSERVAEQLQRWFQDSSGSLMGDVDFGLVARTAVGMIERLNPDVRGKHFIDVEAKHLLRARHFTALVQILFFLLDNAVRHSCVNRDCYLTCVTFRTNERELLICVENRVKTAEEAKSAASTINAKIAELNKQLDPAKILKEGGSGFGKIVAALQYEFKRQAKQLRAYSKDTMLCVCLICAIDGISYEDPDRR